MSDSIYTNVKVFTEADRLQISQCRRLPNQLGFAYMLAYVRMYGRFPKQVPLEVVHEPLQMACLALNCDPSLINDYAQRQQTVSTHRIKIQKYLGLKVLKSEAEKQFIDCLQQEAMRTDRLSALVTYGKQWLLKNHFIYPSETTISRLVASARKMARETMSEKLITSLAPSMI